MTITNSNFAKAIFPGLKKICGDTYAMYPEQFSEFTYKHTSDKNREEYLGFSGLGLAAIKGEGAATSFDDMEQGLLSTITNTSYGLGYKITREARDDGNYMEMATARTKALARSARITKETVCANMLNRGFNTSYTGPDGVELFSTAHLNKSGSTFSNELATAADLSEASLETALIAVADFTDDRGLQIACNTTKLVVPNELRYEAKRILGSNLRVGTAENDLNAIKELGEIEGGYCVNNYLTDADAFFLITDITSKMGDGLVYQERVKDEFANDSDFVTDNAQFKYYGRYASGWNDSRGAFGSPGA